MSVSVLIVDDEPLIVRNLTAYLEDEGMEVDAAGSAEDAIDRVRAAAADRFAVCIMDMRLPGMDGNRAIRALHALRPALAFIVHTGSSNYAIPDDLRALGVGEAQLFRKPVADMAPLAAMVRKLAGGPGA